MADWLSSALRAARYAAGALLATALIPVFAAAAEPTYRPLTVSEAPSFELWCVQIQLYPAARCDARNSGDTEEYEHYRSLVEQFAQTRAAQEERQHELMNRLDRDPTSKPGEWLGLQ